MRTSNRSNPINGRTVATVALATTFAMPNMAIALPVIQNDAIATENVPTVEFSTEYNKSMLGNIRDRQGIMQEELNRASAEFDEMMVSFLTRLDTGCEPTEGDGKESKPSLVETLNDGLIPSSPSVKSTSRNLLNDKVLDLMRTRPLTQQDIDNIRKMRSTQERMVTLSRQIVELSTEIATLEDATMTEEEASNEPEAFVPEACSGDEAPEQDGTPIATPERTEEDAVVQVEGNPMNETDSPAVTHHEDETIQAIGHDDGNGIIPSQVAYDQTMHDEEQVGAQEGGILQAVPYDVQDDGQDDGYENAVIGDSDVHDYDTDADYANVDMTDGLVAMSATTDENVPEYETSDDEGTDEDDSVDGAVTDEDDTLENAYDDEYGNKSNAESQDGDENGLPEWAEEPTSDDEIQAPMQYDESGMTDFTREKIYEPRDETEETPSLLSSVRSELIDAAYSQIGVPYVYGAESPNEAFDCSGFTSWAYSQIGVDLPHSSVMQSDMASPVDYDDLQVGDLVFYIGNVGASQSGSHVAMYAGDGQVIHANGSEVTVGYLNDSYTSLGRFL